MMLLCSNFILFFYLKLSNRFINFFRFIILKNVHRETLESLKDQMDF